ncbi:hypothetical protein Q6272_31790, partial [Klebsiella pneumoniae]|uniref:hypothetical protein n=1 Tax=Klebsiella pneumoniae TaxID=573 RepID=UPI00272F40A3
IQCGHQQRPLEPANPNSSLAAVATQDDGLLVALNDLQDGRFKLSLYGTDARSCWRGSIADQCCVPPSGGI